MRAHVDEPVPVGRTAPKESALHRRLRTHGRPDSGLEPGALALRHAAEEHHHQVVGLGARVDLTADLRHPERDAVVREDGERQAELVAVERALRLADDDRIEPAVRPGERGEEPSCLRSPLPWERPALPDVEELGDHLAAGRLDELPAAVELPLLRRLGVLLVLGTDPAVEGEADHGVDLR